MVKRYDITMEKVNPFSTATTLMLKEHPRGDLVKYEDYERERRAVEKAALMLELLGLGGKMDDNQKEYSAETWAAELRGD